MVEVAMHGWEKMSLMMEWVTWLCMAMHSHARMGWSRLGGYMKDGNA